MPAKIINMSRDSQPTNPGTWFKNRYLSCGASNIAKKTSNSTVYISPSIFKSFQSRFIYQDK